MNKLYSIFFLLILGHRVEAKLNDVQIVALTIVGEGRGEWAIGMTAIANVLQNRSLSKHKTAREIGLVPKQFSFCNEGIAQDKVDALFACPQAVYATSLAGRIVHGDLLADVTGKATHYHALSCSPKWADKRF